MSDWQPARESLEMAQVEPQSDEDDEDMPLVPDDVEFSFGSFKNAQGLKLATFAWKKRAIKIKGIVWLCHGYAGHTIHEWFLPSEPGQPHDMWEGTVISSLVSAGFAVHTLDQQGHGYSDGLKGLRAYFDSFDDFAHENLDCLKEEVLRGTGMANLPTFILGISMGGATALRMAQLEPDIFTGAVLYSPMISLEEVKKKKIFCCITNGSLKPIVGCLDALMPTSPIAKPEKNTHNPENQQEFDNDPLTWHGDVRVRVARGFSDITDFFMEGGLTEMRVPFITFHSVRDSYTDPAGSQALLDMAESSDKTYAKIGPGEEVDVDIWHSLTTEPGHDIVAEHALKWLNSRV